MPSGRTHDRITVLSLPGLALVGYIFTRRFDLILWFSGAYLFSGLMFGPDLDIYSLQYKRWGIIRWIWLPYRSCLKHRSFFSHGFLVGTLLRVVYLSTIVMILAIFGVAIAQLFWGFPWNWQTFSYNTLTLVTTDYGLEAIALWVGLELGAMSHSISDRLGTAIKRSQKKTRSRTPKRKKITRRN
ncbi:metal-binding protein [Crocosphaera sp. UHCC 0190]|uniref:metal-binding protein n=1 Tax=Crocosphaera sp. UHCC 0190 TaxID=3110246 RepID=UPI002B20B636|nr:metal-binding protein [Crocosphaera sp. UHCC 0190]MEA5508469.1 metal-binding protein [Crocosphaera sp. UHCC 0190]